MSGSIAKPPPPIAIICRWRSLSARESISALITNYISSILDLARVDWVGLFRSERLSVTRCSQPNLRKLLNKSSFLSTKSSIANVAQTWDNITNIIEVFVDRCGVDNYTRIILTQLFQSWGCSDN
jgi:hypothetical protein